MRRDLFGHNMRFCPGEHLDQERRGGPGGLDRGGGNLAVTGWFGRGEFVMLSSRLWGVGRSLAAHVGQLQANRA